MWWTVKEFMEKLKEMEAPEDYIMSFCGETDNLFISVSNNGFVRIDTEKYIFNND